MAHLGPTAGTKHRVAAEPPEQVDVAIVGCGTAGLMAGAELQTRGARVAMFDHHYVAGGCASQFSRGVGADRYRFDVGLHYIGDCGPGGTIPRLLGGVGVEQVFVQMDPDGFDTLVFPDVTFKVPASLELYRERLLALFPGEERGIDRYVRLVEEVMHVGRQMELGGGKLTPRALLAVALGGRLVARHQTSTIGELLDGCTRDPILRAIILGQHGDYALPPSETSAVLHAGLAGHYFGGAYYPEGGGQIISDKLADRIEACGGTIHLRRGVAAILVEGGRAVGVRTEPRGNDPGREIRARVVLSAADLKRTLLELVPPEALPARWRSRAEGFVMAGALFMTYLGVQGDMRELGMRRSNYWQFDGYDFDAMYRQARASDHIAPRACYITSASLKDPSKSHAPPGVCNLEVMTLVEGDPRKWGVEPDRIDGWRYKKSERYRAVKQAVEDDMIARLERVFPGSAERVVFRESATPVTQARYTRATGGSGYGLACTPEQFLHNRPGYKGPLPGLYLCGMSTRAGHGIVGAMLGGHHAARLVLDRLASGR